jgi:hypothetical protein
VGGYIKPECFALAAVLTHCKVFVEQTQRYFRMPLPSGHHIQFARISALIAGRDSHSPIDDPGLLSFEIPLKTAFSSRGAVGTDAASASRVSSPGLEVVEGQVWNCFDRSQPLGVNGGAEDVEEVALRMARGPIALFPGVKWPHSMRADGQHRHIVAVAFGDLLLDLG